MTSGHELDRFLGELRTRRERVLELVDPAGLRAVDLLDELRELSEQLLVADEELRVQQEELETARGALLSLSAERELLLQHTSRAYVVTDEHGVVLRSTRGAQQLVRQPQARLVPRPIASWFAVADRRTVRGLVTRATASAGPQSAVGVHLVLPAGERVRVDLVVAAVADGDADRPVLRWELVPVETRLHALPGPVQAVDGAAEEGPLALRLASAAVELQLSETRDELVARLRTAALQLVPGAEDVVVGLGDDQDETGDLAPGSAPGRSVVVAMEVGTQRYGLLTVRLDDALPRETGDVAAALGLHAAVALRRLDEVHHLRQATTAREVVGRAVGMLVERHGISPEEAFARLVKDSQDHNVRLRVIAAAVLGPGQEPPPLRRP